MMEDMSTKKYEYVDQDDHKFDNHCDNDYVDDFYDE